jgi:hypothetical protein
MGDYFNILFALQYRISGFFLRLPNFRFIRDSHRSAKKRIHVNFRPFYYINIFIYLNNCIDILKASFQQL